MGKIKNWFKAQSEYSRTLFFLTIFIHFAYAVFFTNAGYLISDYGFDIFLGRILGESIARILYSFFIASILSSIVWFIFKKLELFTKRYFDYFATFFFALSLLILYQSWKIQQLLETLL